MLMLMQKFISSIYLVSLLFFSPSHHQDMNPSLFHVIRFDELARSASERLATSHSAPHLYSTSEFTRFNWTQSEALAFP